MRGGSPSRTQFGVDLATRIIKLCSPMFDIKQRKGIGAVEKAAGRSSSTDKRGGSLCGTKGARL